MKKPVKILVGLAAVVIVVAGAAVLGARLYLTKDRVLGWVVPPLEAKLHREVAVVDAGGGLTGLYLDGLDVRAAGADQPLVAVDRLMIRWNLWALLSGRVEIREVRLVAPRIHVVRLADGRLDIDDLLAPGGAGEEPTAPSGSTPSVGTGGGLDLVVALFALEDGRVSFEDRTAAPPRTLVLDDIDSSVSGFRLDGPVSFTLSALLPGSREARFRSEGEVNLSAGDLSARLWVDPVPLVSLNPLLGPDPVFSGGIAELDASVSGRLVGAVRVDGGARVEGLVLGAGARAGDPADVEARFKAAYDPERAVATLTGLDVTAAGQELRMEGTAERLDGRPRVAFSLTSPRLQVDPLVALLPGEEAGTPAGTDTPPADEAGTEAGPAAPAVDVTGDIAVDRLEAGGAVLETVRAHVELDHGQLRLEPVSAVVYGGDLDAGVEADLGRPGPPFTARASLAGTRVGKLLAGLDPKLADVLTGDLSATVDAEGAGGDLAALNATVQAEVTDGKLVDHPLVGEFARLFGTRDLEKIAFYSLAVDASAEGGRARVNRFVLRGKDLQATGTGTVGLTGDRPLDLRLAVAVPRRLTEKVVKNPAVLDAVTDDQGWSRLPLLLNGTAQAPRYALDAKRLAQLAAKPLQDRAEKLLEDRVPEGLPGAGELKGLIDKLPGALLGK